MTNPYNITRTIIQSFYSGTLYKEVAQEWNGLGIIYILLLSLIMLSGILYNRPLHDESALVNNLIIFFLFLAFIIIITITCLIFAAAVPLMAWLFTKIRLIQNSPRYTFKDNFRLCVIASIPGTIISEIIAVIFFKKPPDTPIPYDITSIALPWYGYLSAAIFIAYLGYAVVKSR